MYSIRSHACSYKCYLGMPALHWKPLHVTHTTGIFRRCFHSFAAIKQSRHELFPNTVQRLSCKISAISVSLVIMSSEWRFYCSNNKCLDCLEQARQLLHVKQWKVTSRKVVLTWDNTPDQMFFIHGDWCCLKVDNLLGLSQKFLILWKPKVYY